MDRLDDFADALFLTTTEGRVLAWNREAESLFGVSAERAVGADLDRLLGLPDAPWNAALMAPDGRLRLDVAVATRDAVPLRVELAVRVAPAAGPEPQRFAISARDVTLTRCREQARVLETRFRGLLDAAPDALLIVGPEGRILLANREARRLFGFADEEVAGLPVEALVPAAVRGRHAGHRDSFSAHPETRPMGAGRELSALRRDGSEFPAEISLSPLQSDVGPLVAAAVRDISERVRIEELKRKAVAEEEGRRRAEEQNRLKSEFLANMSHELRTPLNSIVGFAELIHDGKVGPVNAEQREYLGDVLAAARHLVQLINDLLDLSKVEAGRLDFVSEPVDLGALVHEVCDAARPLTRKHGISVEIEVDAQARQVRGDAGRLRQVLWNYLSNALKFTPDGGNVRVRVVEDGPAHLRLDVDDDGVGIDPADLGRLFQVFQQLDAGAAKRHGGTGLGLALTRRLVEAMGGHVGVDSEPGRGSRFFARLPRHMRAVGGA